jgi:4-amino-4-deoxy-L-arabinose transferase-like glycosyltransferase
MTEYVPHSRKLLVVLALLLAFAFLGSRGLWDPDEGRYTNVALTMLDTGDWVTPRRNDDTGHWTKPPLTYWSIAASVSVLGRNPWAARVPSALSFLLCIGLAWRCARRLAPGTQANAALAYMTMLMPVIAGQLVTTDFLLAATQTLAVTGFVEWRFGEGSRRNGWLWLMWFGFAAAFLTKGPPSLLPLLVIGVFSMLAPSGRPMPRGHLLGGFALFLMLVLPWFVVVTYEHRGLLDYFLHGEIIDRVASNRFRRHGEWYGWLEVYLPTLLLGTLPWTLRLWRWGAGLPAAIRRWRDPAQRGIDAPRLFLALWIGLPLLVFCLARSRLPLYLLPLFVPLALAIGTQGPVLARRYWIAAWLVLLLLLRFGFSQYPSGDDAAAWAREIQARTQGRVSEVVFVEDLPRFGLRLHLGVQVESLSIEEMQQAAFNPEFDESLRRELEETGKDHSVVYVTKARKWPRVRAKIAAQGFLAEPLGAPFHGRILFEVRPADDATSPGVSR